MIDRRSLLAALALGGCVPAAATQRSRAAAGPPRSRLWLQEGARAKLFPTANLAITRFGHRGGWTGPVADIRWRNRAFPPISPGGARKPNDPGGAMATSNGQRCGCDFSTWQRALRADCVQDAYAAGYPERGPWARDSLGWRDFADGDFHPALSGSRFPATSVIPFVRNKATADRVFTLSRMGYMTALDVVVLPRGTLADEPRGQWFFGDEEADDGRGPDAYLLSVALRARIAHAAGLKYAIAFDPLDGAGANLGITAGNGPKILAAVDAIALPFNARGGDPSARLDAQAAVFGPDAGSKALASMDGPASFSLAQARSARAWIERNNAVGGVIIPSFESMTSPAAVANIAAFTS